VSRLIRAVIDTRALRGNLAAVRARAPGAHVMAVVKANAYGHGLVPTALALADADAFAVARLEEGLALRAAGVTKAIVLLEGVFASEQLLEAARHGFDIVVHDPLQIELLEAFSGQHRFVVWLKIDTGMNRLGFRPADFPVALARVRSMLPAPLEIRVLTHLARADDRDAAANREQIARFNSAVGTLDYVTSIANSAGVLSGAGIHADWVRPGLALYGVSPFGDQKAADLGLQPVMALESTVLTVRRVPKGETVGYSGVWRAQRDSTIAIVAAGYGDGLPRNLPSDTPVLIAGHRATIAGRVSMDMIAVDVTDLPSPHVGDSVTLWGEGLPVEEIARHAGTIPYELLCGVSQRVPLELR
jgi:alanine racemase